MRGRAALDPARGQGKGVNSEVDALGRPLREVAAHKGDGFFPLPALVRDSSPGDRLSRSVKRRVRKSSKLNACGRETVEAVNALAGFSTPVVSSVQEMSDLGKAAWSRCRDLHECMPAPDGEQIQAQEACQALLGFSGDAYTAEPSAMRPYLREKVAWPDVGNHPKPLVDRLPEADQQRLLRDCLHKQDGCADDFVRSESEFNDLIRECGRPTVYGDPIFKRDRSQYLQFVADGVKRGVFSLGTKRRESVDVFFVCKKDGTLRLIVDCRHSNQRFKPPPGVSLFSAAGFGEVRCESGRPLYYAEVDVRHAFYQHAMPWWLREYFCLPSVTGAELKSVGIYKLAGRFLADDEIIFPQMAVVPMGWCWALYLVQTAHAAILKSELDSERCAVDFVPPPRPEDGALYSLYVDNLLVEGHSPEEVTGLMRKAKRAWERAGLVCHGDVEAVSEIEGLGGYLSGSPPVSRTAPRRREKVRQALTFLLERRKEATSRELERLIGHLTFVSLERREILSCFRAVYSFVQAGYSQPHRLWPSVVRELRIFRGVLPLLLRRLDACTDTTVRLFDACETGHASVAGVWGQERVDKHVCWHERWRYKRKQDVVSRGHEAVVVGVDGHDSVVGLADVGDDLLATSTTIRRLAPRHRSTIADELIDERRIAPCDSGEYIQQSQFPEISGDWLKDTEWKITHYTPLKEPEPMHMKEGRGFVKTLQDCLSDPLQWSSRKLFLGDNLGLCLAQSKGRCRDAKLLMLMRRAAATLLVSGCCVVLRWLPSELNAADAPSRRGWTATPGVEADTRKESAGKQSSSGGGLLSGSKLVGDAGHQGAVVCGAPDSSDNCCSDALGGASEWACATPEEHDERDEFGGGSVGGTQRARKLWKAPARFSLSDSLGKLAGGSDGARRCLGPVFRPPLLGGTRSECGSKAFVGDNVLCASVCQPGESESSQGVARIARLGQVDAGVDEEAASLVCGLRDRALPVRLSLYDALLAPDGGLLFQAVGVGGDGLLSGDSSAKGPRHDQHCFPCESRLFRESQQNRRIGRESAGGSPLARTSSGALLGAASLWPAGQGPASLEFRSSGVEVSFCGGGGQGRNSLPAPSAVHGASHRSELGPARGSAHTGRGAKARPMAKRQLGKEVREACVGTRSSRENAPSQGSLLPTVRTKAARNARAAVVRNSLDKSVLGAYGYFFVELFSGCGAFSAALRKRGYKVYSFDILQGPDGDLTRPSVRRRVYALLRSGMCLGLLAGVPCTSFSMALFPKDRGRSKEFPMGKPNLEERIAKKVKIGNRLLAISASFFSYCYAREIPVMWENPWCSLQWETPIAKKFAALPHVEDVRLDMCGYGARWKKPTRLRCMHLVRPDRLQKICSGRVLGGVRCCQFSLKPHIVLRGRDERGANRTAVAAAYPMPLAHKMAEIFVDTASLGLLAWQARGCYRPELPTSQQ